MTTVTIQCPQCTASLRLPDRSLLGRKGCCPRCKHRFVLQEPAEVPLELVETTTDPPLAVPSPPPTGKSARWVPDAAATSPTEIPAFVPPASADDQSIAARVRQRHRRRGSRGSRWILIGTCASVFLGTIIAIALLNRQPPDPPAAATPPAPQANLQWQADQQAMADSNEQAAALSPTSGEPVPLNYIPFSPQLILHLRPAEMWQRDRQLKEFEAMLGTVAIWLKDSIRGMTTFEPEEIEELTFAVNFGVRTSDPDVAAVVRLREPQGPGNLFLRFRGTRRTDLDREILETDKFSYLIVDQRTFAVAGVSLSEPLDTAGKYPALPTAELEPLLKESDRDRHCTLLLDLPTLDVHREHVLREELWSVADQFIVWMGPDVRTVSWSLHLKPNFYLETLLRPANSSSPVRVQRSMLSSLQKLPELLLAEIGQMQPATTGRRQIIGRFPAMMKAVSQGTTADVGRQYARFVTILPGKAAANLAAGALLTWNESLIHDSLSDTQRSIAATDQSAESVEQRLNRTVLIDFRNFPLQEAVAYISDVIGAEITIDGGALKAAGFTQNLDQTMDLGTVTAHSAFATILRQYAAERDPMVLTLDPGGRGLIVETQSSAEQTGHRIVLSGD